MQIKVETNFGSVAQAISRLGTEVYQKAAVSAMNKTVAKARTAMSREIREEFALKASTVNDKLQIRRASWSQGLAQIHATLESSARRGRSMNVIHFTARQTAAGVSVRIKRVNGRKVIKGAFIANKGRVVFRRDGKTRLPISPVQVIGVPQMFNTRRIHEKVVEMVKREFPDQFDKEAKFYLSRVGM